MSRTSLKYILSLLSVKNRDFSVFVSGASKIEKERILKRAANRAIEQQRQILEGFTTA